MKNMFNILKKPLVTEKSKLGKRKRLGKSQGKRPDRKKAIVTLKEGDRIEFFEGV